MMLSSLKSSWPKLTFVVGLLLLCSALGEANTYWGRSGGRAYYGHRNSHFYYGPYWGQQRNYHTYYYYYRPTPAATEYSYHTCAYYPEAVGNIQGNYYYYKNQRTGNWWGRCHPGGQNYELLAENVQGPNLVNIQQKDFVPQGKMTAVPNMQPEAPIIPPPMPSAPPAE